MGEGRFGTRESSLIENSALTIDTHAKTTYKINTLDKRILIELENCYVSISQQYTL